MTKRTIAVLALAVGAVLGATAGFLLHAPGRSSTWNDVRSWGTFVVVVAGFSVAAYELNLQRLQFAEEARRNAGRDDLLDRQRRELQHSETLRMREQANDVDVVWDYGLGSTVEVVNRSRRPISDVACQFRPGEGDALLRPKGVGETMDVAEGRAVMSMTTRTFTEGWRVPVIRPRDSIGFSFEIERMQYPDGVMLARFTDDNGMCWQLDHDLHLVQLDDSTDW